MAYEDTIDTLELPRAASVVELGAVEHVPHPVGLLVVLTAVSLVQAFYKLVLFSNLGAGKDITTFTVGLPDLENKVVLASSLFIMKP